MEYVDSMEDSLIEIVRTHQHNTNYAMSARNLKREFQRETRQIDILPKNTKRRWQGKRMHGHFASRSDENGG
jgi:hypothetical protein